MIRIRDFWPMVRKSVSGDNCGMASKLSTGKLERVAGVVTWAFVTGFAAWIAVVNGGRYADMLPAFVLLALFNLVAMWLAMREQNDRRLRLAALWAQLASALALGLLLPVSFLPIYTIIWMSMATGFYRLSTCLWLLGGILLAWYLVMTFAWQEEHAAVTVFLYGTFHLFAVLTARNAHEAQEARLRAETLNRELVATQHLLSEASRQNERTRIARDLHDLLGHHLTALSLNLQVAERLSEGEAKEKVGQGRALARLLLADVREAVSTLREEKELDVTRSLGLLAANVPGLDIELDIDDSVEIDDVEIAETLLRCVQEAITNTLRHAGASRCWIRLWQAGGRVNLDIRDDGSVRAPLAEGNGLAGMRERLAAVSGSLNLESAGNALRMRVEIPVAG